MGKSQGEVDLQEEVFNILPGTVNATQGAAMYQSLDQAFSLHKQVQFGDRPNWPDLKLDGDLGDQVPTHNLPHSSTPYHINPTNPLNYTFYVSGILPLSGNPQELSIKGVLAYAGAQDYQVQGQIFS